MTFRQSIHQRNMNITNTMKTIRRLFWACMAPLGFFPAHLREELRYRHRGMEYRDYGPHRIGMASSVRIDWRTGQVLSALRYAPNWRPVENKRWKEDLSHAKLQAMQAEGWDISTDPARRPLRVD